MLGKCPMNVQDIVTLSFIPICLKIMKKHMNINNMGKPSGVTGSFSNEISCWREDVNVRCGKACRCHRSLRFHE